MNFHEFVEQAVNEDFVKQDDSLHFASIDTKGGSFIRFWADDEPGVAWMIVTNDGFIQVGGDHCVRLEAKYQEFIPAHDDDKEQA